jgi:exonuclease III
MLMDLIPPSKDTTLQTGLKRKIQQSVVYRRPSHHQKQALAEGERLEEDLPNQWPPPKQAGVAIFILDKIDFKFTLIKRDKEGHSILIKGEIHQKKITIINLYAPNVNAPNFITHTLKDLKTYINSSTVIVGDLNTSLSLIDRSSKQKVNK